MFSLEDTVVLDLEDARALGLLDPVPALDDIPESDSLRWAWRREGRLIVAWWVGYRGDDRVLQRTEVEVRDDEAGPYVVIYGGDAPDPEVDGAGVHAFCELILEQITEGGSQELGCRPHSPMDRAVLELEGSVTGIAFASAGQVVARLERDRAVGEALCRAFDRLRA
jgi:hypothetical protein